MDRWGWACTRKTAESSSFSSSVIHKEIEPHQKQINYFYTELFNNLLDENCYPTKYIFEDCFAKVDEFGYDDDRNYNSDFNLRIKKDVKLSGEYLSKRLPDGGYRWMDMKIIEWLGSS